MMSEPSLDLQRPPFRLWQGFLETAFERRFQRLLQSAWQNRSWHVIGAVPGCGKSLGIHDLIIHSAPSKAVTGVTRLPVLAIRAPKNESREHALAGALCAAFGKTPNVPLAVRRTWLVEVMASASVECLIIDDAQDLNLAHLALLKELTDNLAAPPYQRQIGLCLVVAHSGSALPLKEVFSRPDTLWRQFRRRLDTERRRSIAISHTDDAVSDILATLEDLYRDQFPDLHLSRWAHSFYTWLTNPILDIESTGRVTMDHLIRLVNAALKRTYEESKTDVTAEILQMIAELMILRRGEITVIGDLPTPSAVPVKEVG